MLENILIGTLGLISGVMMLMVGVSSAVMKSALQHALLRTRQARYLGYRQLALAGCFTRRLVSKGGGRQ